MRLRNLIYSVPLYFAPLALIGCMEEPVASSEERINEESPSLLFGGVPAEENLSLTEVDKAEEYYGSFNEKSTVYHNSNRREVTLDEYRSKATPLLKVPVDYSILWGRDMSLEIKVWECTGSGAHVVVNCDVDSDYFLVGGGGWAEGGLGLNEGALLTGSHPTSNFITWSAQSKDHLKTYPHTLHTYAVGLKSSKMSSSDVRTSGMITIVTSLSGSAQHPSIRTGLPATHELVGGGARVYLNGQGNLLTRSYPYDHRSWMVSSKDHGKTNFSQIRAYAIGIAGPERYLGFITDRRAHYWSDNSWDATTKIQTTWNANSLPLITCPGAVSLEQGASYNPGRLLNAIIPSARSVKAIAKPHVYNDYGKVGVSFVSVGISPLHQ